MRWFRKIVLRLFVIFAGVALGAGVYESKIMVPQWLVTGPGGERTWDAEAARLANTGVEFWAYVTTFPLTLLTVLSLVLAWTAPQPLRRWWFVAAVISLVDRVFTFTFFIPTMIRLISAEVPMAQSEAVPTAVLWQNLDLVRDVITLLTFLAALGALSVASSAEDRLRRS